MGKAIPHGTTGALTQNCLIELIDESGDLLTGIAYDDITEALLIFDDDADTPIDLTASLVVGTLGAFIAHGWIETSMEGVYQFSLHDTYVATAGRRAKLLITAPDAKLVPFDLWIYDANKGLGDPAYLTGDAFARLATYRLNELILNAGGILSEPGAFIAKLISEPGSMAGNYILKREDGLEFPLEILDAP